VKLFVRAVSGLCRAQNRACSSWSFLLDTWVWILRALPGSRDNDTVALEQSREEFAEQLAPVVARQFDSTEAIQLVARCLQALYPPLPSWHTCQAPRAHREAALAPVALAALLHHANCVRSAFMAASCHFVCTALRTIVIGLFAARLSPAPRPPMDEEKQALHISVPVVLGVRQRRVF
jgi:hypothetical protein